MGAIMVFMRHEHKKTIICIAIAFLALVVSSAVRQVDIRFVPPFGRVFVAAEPFRQMFVFSVHLILLAAWWASILRRITQRNMRVFLICEHFVMLFWIIIRLLQSTVLANDMYASRVSGYFSVIPTALLPLLGLFASFGLGKTENYRIAGAWYWMFVPAAALIALMLTNESHHWVFRLIESETPTQPNLYYHANAGIYAALGWAYALLFARIIIIYIKSRRSKEFGRLRIAPLAVAVAMLLFNIPYVISSYVSEYEIIENFIVIFFLEIVVWESCIMLGMIPVNTRYEDVFDRSTVAMRIVDQDGKDFSKSAAASSELSAETFGALKSRQSAVRTPDGQEMHIRSICGGYAIWQFDVSQTIAVIDELHRTAERMEQDGEFLRHELKLRSEESAVREQNQIYNRLSREVRDQLLSLRGLLEKREREKNKSALFFKICLIGTYIKRRCNLRLIEQSDHSISSDDLNLCFLDLTASLNQIGADASVTWNTDEQLPPEFAIFAFDLFEFLIELERFELHAIKAVFEPGAVFTVKVFSDGAFPGQIPADKLRRINAQNYEIAWRAAEDAYQVTVSGSVNTTVSATGSGSVNTTVSGSVNTTVSATGSGSVNAIGS